MTLSNKRDLLSTRFKHSLCTSSVRFRYPNPPSVSYQSRNLHLTTLYPMPAETDSRYEDFYHYTSGRWVWDEEQQLRDRFRKFNVPELQRVAAKSVGAKACVSMARLADGSFNKVFRLIMDNGEVAIARIPNPSAGPEFYSTASDVATMDFVLTKPEVSGAYDLLT